MILSDLELYNYLLCSKKYKFLLDMKKQSWEPNIRLMIWQRLLSKLSEEKDLSNIVSLHKEICDEYKKDILFHIDNVKKVQNLITKLKLWNLSLVSGSQTSIYQYGDIKYSITLDALFVTNKGALRGLCITPYQFKKDISWNVAHRMQYEFLKDIYKAKGFIDGQSAKLFFVGAGDKGYSLNYIDRNLPQNIWKKEIETISADIKNKRHWPLSPCPYFTCEFRQKCIPGE